MDFTHLFDLNKIAGTVATGIALKLGAAACNKASQFLKGVYKRRQSSKKIVSTISWSKKSQNTYDIKAYQKAGLGKKLSLFPLIQIINHLKKIGAINRTLNFVNSKKILVTSVNPLLRTLISADGFLKKTFLFSDSAASSAMLMV